jgi:hypothetical protein
MDREQRLRTLAGQFMQGETSVDEERELLQLLFQDDTPEDLLPLREMMVGLQTIALKEPKTSMQEVTSVKKKTHKPLYRWVAAAAAVILVAGSALVYYHSVQNEYVVIVYGKRYADREMALQEMRKNLTFVADTPTDQVDDLLDDMFDL